MSDFAPPWDDWDGYYGVEDDEEIEICIDEVRAETPKAWLIVYTRYRSTWESWFPKSQCTIEGDRLFVPEWLFDLSTQRRRRTVATKNLLDNFEDLP